MSSTTTSNLTSEFHSYMAKAMELAVGKAFDEAIEEATAKAQARRDEVVAATALKLVTWMRMEDMGRTIRIEIEKPREENNNGL